MRRAVKIFLIVLLPVYGCTKDKPDVRQTISLAGKWGFRIDREVLGFPAHLRR